MESKLSNLGEDLTEKKSLADRPFLKGTTIIAVTHKLSTLFIEVYSHAPVCQYYGLYKPHISR